MTNRNDVLHRWQTEEAAVRARLAAPGVTSPQDLKASSGIEFLQRIFNGELPSPPIAETLGFVPIAAEPGRVVFQGTPDKRHYNPLGGVHGGYFCTLLDSALGCAIHSTLPKGIGYTTLELWGANSQCDAIRLRRAVLHVPVVIVVRNNYRNSPLMH